MCKYRTHTGFVVDAPKGADGEVQFVEAAGLEQLHLDLINKPQSTKRVDWVMAAVKTVHDTILMTKFSLGNQIKAGQSMAPNTVEFIVSCLEYLRTGQRRLGVVLWGDLLDYHSKETVVVTEHEARRLQDTYKDILDLSADELVCLWLQQPGGVEDLVISAHHVFGVLPDNWKEL